MSKKKGHWTLDDSVDDYSHYNPTTVKELNLALAKALRRPLHEKILNWFKRLFIRPKRRIVSIKVVCGPPITLPPPERVDIELWYGHGFGGTDYKMQLDGEWFDLSGLTDGSDESQVAAKENAVKILFQKYKVIYNIDKVPFKWNGTM